MNLLDATVIEILSEPYQSHVFWCVDVTINVYGTVSESTVYFRSKKEAEECSVGYTYKC